MRAVGLELSKLRRKRLWLTVLLVLGFELLWILAILMVSLSRETTAPLTMGYAIGQASQVHAIFAPILATVVVSRLAAMEHDGAMMPVLFAANQSRGSLFLAKYAVAATISTAATIVVVAAVSLAAGGQGVPADPGLVLLWLLGLVLANLAVVAIQLLLALLFQRQAVTLTVGIVGGLVGSFAGFVPTGVAAFIPWQYPGLVTPVRMEQTDGTITGFPLVEHLGALIALVAVVGAVSTVVGRSVFARKVSR
ncbi:ABC transporter permease subunit [Microbacterium sp. 2C]|uniref:ABC transporter permease n=1 Tax=Microbacterium paulum TaxID=2707006 RepID=UPI0018C2413D|nr:ABC transporter permease [Microbacterium paulum]MBG0718180.1 ABC transporter permease subunit [Microbacterium paulum]